MLDLSYLNTQSNADIQIFNRPSAINGGATNNMFTWVKPRGKTMCYIHCLGGGAGGGGGFSRASAADGGGGGGGGSGANTRALIPLLFLPDRLYIQVGAGGIGGTGSGVAGSSGMVSAITIATPGAWTTGNDYIMHSGTTGATGGGAGTGPSGGSAGAGETVVTTTNSSLIYMCLYQSHAGAVGIAGGTNNNAVAGLTLPSATGITHGGGGGAGSTGIDVAGGGWATINGLLSDVAPIAAAAGPNHGCGGPNLGPPAYPLFSYGGGGGGSDDDGTGGTGGNGGTGCGGGGGGAGVTGGAGGRGGHGRVIIICW